MFDIALVIFMQASAPAAAPAAQQAAVAETAAVKDEEKVVCTMEPITGTRARKQKVCKTPGYEKGAERSRDMLSAIQRASNVQPPEPPASGGRPGGPGY